VLDLSASLNPLAPDPTDVLCRHLGAVRRYPDPIEASAALAHAMQIEPARLLLTNGGAEAISLVADHLRTGWVEEPEFSLYRRHLQAIEPGAPRWRSNPHNPSGLLAGPDEQAAVWDEAFFPLASGRWSRRDFEQGAIVIGSLTKLLACPGLRVGYIVSPDSRTARQIADRQPQWALNGLAAAALPELLDRVDLPSWAEGIADLRRELAAVVGRAGFEPMPSDANWLLVHAPGLRDKLAVHAIAVRDCTSFGMPGTVRIAVPDKNGLERLAAALGQLT
jgi:histidinol-phosphate/aromatic aminotransferase/cobyric acid decarboxylase-like protein